MIANLCKVIPKGKVEMLLSIFMNLKGSVVSGTGSLALSREEDSRRSNNPFYSFASIR